MLQPGDLIDSTMAATDATGFAIDYAGGSSPTFVHYSAFGEVLDAAGQPGGSAPAGFPRYQYAGGFGYESDLLALTGANPNLAPITLQHLGWRWYDPATGRFVQRDPIGLNGGINVFAGVQNHPLMAVDPLGFFSIIPDSWLQKLVNWYGPKRFLDDFGGPRHTPILDPGIAQTCVLVGCELTSVAAPVGAVGKVITAGPKAVRAYKRGCVARRLLRIRRYIRYDRHRPHKRSPHPWDGEIPKWIREKWRALR